MNIHSSVVRLFLIQVLSGTIHYNEVRAEDVSFYRNGIKRFHKQLLEFDGGLRISSRVDVEQSDKKPYFLFSKGLNGETIIRWPEFYCREEGFFIGFTVKRAGKTVREGERTTREGFYNFSTQHSVARMNSDLAQITPYRHAFSTHCYVLRNQFFEECDQFFVRGEGYESDYWLPSALTDNLYVITGYEKIAGRECTILERKELDKIWISESSGFMVCKREFNYGVNRGIRERVTVTAAKEIVENVWIPESIIREEFTESGGPLFRLTVTVQKTSHGNISADELRPDLSKSEYINDQVSGVYIKLSKQKERFDDAIRSYQHNVRNRRNPWAIARNVMAVVSMALGVYISIITWGIFRSRNAN